MFDVREMDNPQRENVRNKPVQHSLTFTGKRKAYDDGISIGLCIFLTDLAKMNDSQVPVV